MTPIAVCADDYARKPAINAGILELLEKKALSATSCFSMAPSWREQAAPALRERVDVFTHVDVGLHFNLTEGFGGQAASLNGLILRSLSGDLYRPAMQTMITTALERQLDAFEQGLGMAPDFVDGHHHVHQIRGVREVMLKVLAQRYPQGVTPGTGTKRPWIRNTVRANRSWRGKAHLLELLGGQALAAELPRHGWASNRSFAGVYGFNRTDYGICFAQWLKSAQPGMLIMCHPAGGVGAYGIHDPIVAQGLVEYRYFTSSAYPEALSAAGVQLQRLSALLP